MSSSNTLAYVRWGSSLVGLAPIALRRQNARDIEGFGPPGPRYSQTALIGPGFRSRHLFNLLEWFDPHIYFNNELF